MPIPRCAPILVLGGTGFVGTALAAQLVTRGHELTLPSRDREKVKEDLILLPGVTVIDADIHDPAVLAELVPGHAAVINLVGILHGTPAAFRHAHVELTGKIIAAAQAAGVRRYLHMSALGADVAGTSSYQRSKGEAEALVRASGLDWTIYRPSLIFGQGRCFVSLFANLLKLAPVVPLAGANARMQPVWVEDVARAFVAALEDDALLGQSLNLVGPDIYTLQALVSRIGAAAGHPRPVFGIPNWLGKLQAGALQILPRPPMSRDNVDSLKRDNIDPAGFPTVLGWQPTALEAILPTLLAGGRVRDRFLSLRRRV
ncbi:complex I NDUFA9 subunit family protein [Chitinimonas sp.]|uniref:complex I NDUFA9 subunit family protein n=1 Tax=Chitinimonas sp. TaxID=1934313 RepID=UPI002F929AC3